MLKSRKKWPEKATGGDKKYKDAAFNEKNKLAYTELLITYEQFFDVDAVMESVRTAKDRSFIVIIWGMCLVKG
ncbi:MAG: hypothetical protein HWD59_04370 [Coxiellaceae bacterium]|nr:MAG: hypothetical protein HWD59_04370 [Coxiellaceae bacterium]